MAISVQYRKGRKRWGYAGSHRGKRYTKFAWAEKAEAETAYHKFMLKVDGSPVQEVKETCLSVVAGDYVKDSAFRERSKWRIDALNWNFTKWILPYFGELTRISDISPEDIEKFVYAQKARGVKNSTIWHYVTDLRACFNWAIKKSRRGASYGITLNPVDDADLSPIKNRKVVKMPLDPKLVDKAAEALGGQDRIYFDCLRWTGLRKDEANRLQWKNFDLERDPGLMIVPGTKRSPRTASRSRCRGTGCAARERS